MKINNVSSAMMVLLLFVVLPWISDKMTKIDEVQSTFWREWKFKLEEKKRIAEQSRELEKIIPGVETGRFLSGDFDYIKSAVISLIESVKLEKKHIIWDVLKLADDYGLNRSEVCWHAAFVFR